MPHSIKAIPPLALEDLHSLEWLKLAHNEITNIPEDTVQPILDTLKMLDISSELAPLIPCLFLPSVFYYSVFVSFFEIYLYIYCFSSILGIVFISIFTTTYHPTMFCSYSIIFCILIFLPLCNAVYT